MDKVQCPRCFGRGFQWRTVPRASSPTGTCQKAVPCPRCRGAGEVDAPPPKKAKPGADQPLVWGSLTLPPGHLQR